MDVSAIRIERSAEAFRSAMNIADRSTWGDEFEHFPLGACGDSSLMLGEFLFELGCGTFEYFSGDCDGWHHAWIENGGVIVDITGDQFPEFGKPVYVGRDRTWHSRYTINTTHMARLNVFGPDVERKLRRIYSLVMKGLSAPDRPCLGSKENIALSDPIID